jgi:hypothetical protein
VALLQAVPQHRLDHHAEAHPGEARQPPGQLGVEQPGGHHAYVPQARQVLRGGVQHPLGGDEGLPERGEVGAGGRVHQGRAGAVAPELHEVRALPVPVPGGALGVDGHGAAARREGADDALERVGVGGDRGHSLPRRQQGDRRRT